jgi:hypothetical protein
MAGVATRISEDRILVLDRKWKPFQSVVAEEAPSCDSANGHFTGVDQFCPEVSYDIFGYFACALHRYADEIDQAIAMQSAKRHNALQDLDVTWNTIVPRHYTECREYSIHGSFADTKPRGVGRRRTTISAGQRWQVLARDGFTCTYCGRKPPDVALEVDHRTSLRDGGSDELQNLVTACSDCNRGKGGSSTPALPETRSAPAGPSQVPKRRTESSDRLPQGGGG